MHEKLTIDKITKFYQNFILYFQSVEKTGLRMGKNIQKLSTFKKRVFKGKITYTQSYPHYPH
jgi:hypothetical protein